MNGMKKKLRSRKGASITFALLIFLVCAVVSSVVIVAASAAGGRLSTVKEMDQRYYAATSAAEVLRDRLNDQSVTVSYTKNASDGKVTAASTTTTGILGEVSKCLVASTQPTAISTITRKVDDIDYSCAITPTLANGMLTFDISVTGGKTNNGTYTLSMIFSSTTMMADDAAADPAATTVTGKAKVTWKMNSIKKIKA